MKGFFEMLADGRQPPKEELEPPRWDPPKVFLEEAPDEANAPAEEMVPGEKDFKDEG